MKVSPKRSRSTNPVAAKQRKAKKEWEDSNIPIAFERDSLRSISMTPGNHHNLLTEWSIQAIQLVNTSNSHASINQSDMESYNQSDMESYRRVTYAYLCVYLCVCVSVYLSVFAYFCFSFLCTGGAAAPLRYRDKMDEISDQPYSSVGQRDYFFSAELGRKGRSNTFPTTPNFVSSLNELNSSSFPTKLPSIADAHKSTDKHLQPYGGNWPDDSIRHLESYNKSPHRRFFMSVCFLKHAYTIMIRCLALLMSFSPPSWFCFVHVELHFRSQKEITCTAIQNSNIFWKQNWNRKKEDNEWWNGEW